MPTKVICQGAEAKIYLKDNWITKDRISKSYRHPELDKQIRKRRTKSETKLLTKASLIINSPVPENLKELDKIKMPFIQGKKLSEYLDKFPIKEQKEIMKKLGESIAKLHKEDIIHGDLTTSNMIYTSTKKKGGGERTKKVFLIDFGLGFISNKFEDKAVDIHLFRQALEAKHFQNWKKLFAEFLKAYKKFPDSKIILERLKDVEKRGRYKH